MLSRMIISTFILSLASVEVEAWNPGADCPAVPEDPVQAHISAGRLFNEAEQQYHSSRPIEALEGFLCSFRIIQHENTLFNIAQIAKLSKHRTAALALLRDFVSKTRGRVKVEPIEDLIAELEQKAVPHEAPETPEAAEAEPTAEVIEAQPQTASSTPSEAPTQPENRTGLSTSGWVLLAAGGAAAVAGGVLQGLAGSAQQQAEESNTYPDFQDAKRRMTGFQTGAYVGFATGGALMGVGLSLLVASKKKGNAEETKVSIGAIPMGVELGGTF
jgi:hypothetical protein